MGKRKRPLSHKWKRTRASNPSGGLLKQNHNAQQRIPFMDLPPEIRDAVLQDLRLRDLAVLVLTSKAVRAYVETFLYKKIYTRRNTPHDTKGLMNLLQRRGHIAPMIHILVLDEYHPRHIRRLLSIEMPYLSTLLIQYKEWSVADVSEREKRALNRDVVIQPNIKRRESGEHFLRPNISFPSISIDVLLIASCGVNQLPVVLWKSGQLSLSEQDACLFRQPSLESLPLSYIDFTTFEEEAHRYLDRACLKILFIEVSEVPVLKNISSSLLWTLLEFRGVGYEISPRSSYTAGSTNMY